MTASTVTSPVWMHRVLAAAAAYNLAWGVMMIAIPSQPFLWAGIQPCNYPSLVQCLGMVIGVYGFGYAIAALNPVLYWPLVLTGLIGKVLGPIGFFWTAMNGELPWTAGWMIVFNDLAWWLPFAVILIHAARAQSAQLACRPELAA